MVVINGIIIIDKPAGFTSFDVVAKLRGILKERRIGHSGTLDPMATGVLPVFVGSATKLISFLPNTDKVYTAGFRLGITTDTQDITGTVLSSSRPDVSLDILSETAKRFTGDIMQIPPMYSAVKVGGQKLYKLARAGKEQPQLKSRPITISRLDILEFDGTEGLMEIRCTQGTYIRTIIHDIGQSLGCGGTLTSLRRTQSGCFTLKDCVNLLDFPQPVSFIPMDFPFMELSKIQLDDIQTGMFKNGVRLDINRINGSFDKNARLRIYSPENQFLGLATATDGDLVIDKLVNSDEQLTVNSVQ